MIRVQNLKRHFLQGNEVTEVLKGVDLHIQKGEFVAIMGPSGSGKSTLLQLLGGLDIPTEGSIHIQDVEVSARSEKERTIFRRKNIGFVFQNYQLLSNLTVEENIALPLLADGQMNTQQLNFIHELLCAVGLEGFNKKPVHLLSGGQQQRVAIARALVNRPSVILADEPTGNLDRERAEDILKLLFQFHQQFEQTIVMVTHDIFAASFADKMILFKDGIIDQVITRKDSDYAQHLANFMA